MDHKWIYIYFEKWNVNLLRLIVRLSSKCFYWNILYILFCKSFNMYGTLINNSFRNRKHIYVIWFEWLSSQKVGWTSKENLIKEKRSDLKKRKDFQSVSIISIYKISLRNNFTDFKYVPKSRVIRKYIYVVNALSL